MERTTGARLWTLGCLLALASACGDDDGGETPRPDGSTTQHDGGDASLDARTLDARVADSALDASEEVDSMRPFMPDAAPGTPPSSAFTLSDTQGAGTLWVKATSTAVGGVTPITETLYDFGEGAGFAATNTHRFAQPGTYTVKQQVRDEDGLTATSSATVTLRAFTPVKFSRTDLTSEIRVSADGYEIEQLGAVGAIEGVRSDDVIPAGAGIFYFEAHRIAEPFPRGAVGIATAAAPLAYHFEGTPGVNSQSAVYLLSDGTSESAGGTCTGSALDPNVADVGLIVDYRGSSPVLRLVQGSASAAVVSTCTLPVTSPVYIYFSAERAAVTGELRINTGADTTNMPFHYAPDVVRAALAAAGDALGSQAIQFGFGRTNAGRLDSPPVLAVSGPTTVNLGAAVTLNATVSDLEDGSLDSKVEWVDTSLPHHEWKATVGASFTFTPTVAGTHPIAVRVQDLDGVAATKIVKVAVHDAAAVPSPVKLSVTPEATASGIVVSPDGLSARFNTNEKCGLRANAGLYGAYWYFEVHRNSPTRNMGMGLVTEEGNIVPYEFDDVPWSCSINVLGSGGVYKDLITQVNAGNWQLQGDPDRTDYGFAVDYRQENPTVYVLIGGRVQTTLRLANVWVPLFPMVYGNGPYNGEVQAEYDYTVNFGTKPFAMDPIAVLSAAQVDTTGLQRGWGGVVQ